jgi:transcriptional accessory protein Tex/SPT6
MADENAPTVVTGHYLKQDKVVWTPERRFMLLSSVINALTDVLPELPKPEQSLQSAVAHAKLRSAIEQLTDLTYDLQEKGVVSSSAEAERAILANEEKGGRI